MRLGDCCKTNLHTYSDKEKWSLIRYLDTGSITEGRIDEIQTLYPGVDKIPSRGETEGFCWRHPFLYCSSKSEALWNY